MREFSTLSEDNLFNIALATGEALQNIVRYGYLFEDAHEVRLSLECLDKAFVVKVMDDAPPCPVEKFMHRTLAPTEYGGMGLTIIRKLTHTFDILPSNQGNITILMFNLH